MDAVLSGSGGSLAEVESGCEGALSVAAWFPVPFSSWSCISVSNCKGLIAIGLVAAMFAPSSIVAQQSAERLDPSQFAAARDLKRNSNSFFLVYYLTG